MLAIQTRPKYIEKAVKLPNGEWALVVFELVERNGQIVARAVSGKILSDITPEKEAVLCLPAVKSPVEFIPVVSIFSDLVSNFTRDFAFVISQPTRAPSF
jgi:hypothetical protein